MAITIIRQATVSKEHFLKACPRYAAEELLRDSTNEIRAYVISVLGNDVVFQVYIGGMYMFERYGSTPSDERTGVEIYDRFMAGDPT